MDIRPTTLKAEHASESSVLLLRVLDPMPRVLNGQEEERDVKNLHFQYVSRQLKADIAGPEITFTSAESITEIIGDKHKVETSKFQKPAKFLFSLQSTFHVYFSLLT